MALTESQIDKEYDRILGMLKRDGYRITEPRRAILRHIVEAELPLSVQELCTSVNNDLRAQGIASPDESDPVNLVTVYRFANLLADMGLASRVEFGQGYYRYERAESQSGPHHHHLVCEQCGRVQDFHGCDILGLTRRLEEESGFQITRHQLEMFGRCPECLRAGTPAEA